MDTIDEKFEYIRKETSKASQYETIAEEATELAHVAQKLARYLRGEQPLADSFDYDKERVHLCEEYADLIVAVNVIHPLYDPEKTREVSDYIVDTFCEKLDRWVKRIREDRKNKGENNEH